MTPYVSHFTEKAASGNRNTLVPIDFFNSSIKELSPPMEAIKTIKTQKPPNLLSQVMAKLAKEEEDRIYQGFKKDTTLLNSYLTPKDLNAVGVHNKTLIRKPYKPRKLK